MVGFGFGEEFLAKQLWYNNSVMAIALLEKKNIHFD